MGACIKRGEREGNSDSDKQEGDIDFQKIRRNILEKKKFWTEYANKQEQKKLENKQKQKLMNSLDKSNMNIDDSNYNQEDKQKDINRLTFKENEMDLNMEEKLGDNFLESQRYNKPIETQSSRGINGNFVGQGGNSNKNNYDERSQSRNNMSNNISSERSKKHSKILYNNYNGKKFVEEPNNMETDSSKFKTKKEFVPLNNANNNSKISSKLDQLEFYKKKY